MINFRNFKHIFIMSLLAFCGIFGITQLVSRDFLVPINYFILYRTWPQANWQDAIYTHKTQPWKNIVLIEIDEKTINSLQANNELQSLGISKKYYEDLVKILLQNGVKSVWFDILFQNADHKYELDFAKILEKNQNFVIAMSDAVQKNIFTDDENFLDATNFCEHDIQNPNIVTCPGVPRSVYQNAHWGLISVGNNNSSSTASEKRAIKLNTNSINFSEKDKNIHPLNKKWPQIYTLPLAMLEEENLEKAQKILEKNETHMMQPFFTTREKNEQWNIYTTISFIQILQNPEIYEDILKDAYVFVWESGNTLHDRLISPASNEYIPGMYTHAFFLDSILQNKILEKMDHSTLLIIVGILTVISVSIYFFIPKFLSPFVMIMFLVASIWTGRFLYDQKFLVIDILPVLLASGILTYPLVYIYKFFIIERDKRFILNTFSRYLSPEVVKMIDTQKIESTLGGEKKELSILFSDIAGFTTISEKLDTKDLFQLMTKYLSKMTNILTENHGTLDKYIGDAVMGFFGAPVDDKNHAINACKTAIAMQKALKEINENIEKDGLDSIKFRVGISTGEVMVGNIGSEKRFNYTVLGDTVNLASRLEWMGKEYGVQNIISESTRRIIWQNFLVRELDYIAVKWKNIGTRIFELIDEANANIDTGIYQTYEIALKLYREGQYLEAGKIFEKNMEIDPPSRVMALRCLDILKGKMHIENWIYKMTHK